MEVGYWRWRYLAPFDDKIVQLELHGHSGKAAHVKVESLERAARVDDTLAVVAFACDSGWRKSVSRTTSLVGPRPQALTHVAEVPRA